MRNVLLVVLATILTAHSSAASRDALVTRMQIPGATLRVELMQPIDDDKATEIIEWLRSASTNVSLAYGRFPNPSPRVVVIPAGHRSWGGNSPVP
ncbi:MAG: hypothetical protein ACR2QI_10945, partial [Woeseiaceae bacterium]